MARGRTLLVVFAGIFVFRLAFGLLHASWTDVDERQTYLIGLKSYATGTWPYYGPDLNGAESTYESQLPGALEGLMIAVPLYVLPIPESPFIFLNLMSSTGVVLLAWYICARLPRLSFPWVSLWIAVVPWSLQLATHIINPAYLLLPSVLFFLGFMEAVPSFRLGVIRPALANALMGLSLFWVMQFHTAYVYLVPLSMWALASQIHAARQASSLWHFTLGALPSLACLLPTFLRDGLSRGNPASGFAVPFNVHNAAELPAIVARVLSLPSFELPRFLGNNTANRLEFLQQHPWLLVPALVLAAAGVIQPFVLVYAWFSRRIDGPAWRPLRWLVAVTTVMAAVSFWFTIKRPLSHIFFVLFPLLMIYSCYCWAHFASDRRWRVFAKVFIVVSLLFQAGYAVAKAPTSSLYEDRGTAARAIRERNFHLLGERRPNSLY